MAISALSSGSHFLDVLMVVLLPCAFGTQVILHGFRGPMQTPTASPWKARSTAGSEIQVSAHVTETERRRSLEMKQPRATSRPSLAATVDGRICSKC